MKILCLSALILLPLAMHAQDVPDTEAQRLKDSCGKFDVVGCASTLFTDHPFHIAVGSLAPGNGFAAGPALSFTHDTTPQKIDSSDGETVTAWRLAWDLDAVASANASWRAGAYLTARYSVERPLKVVNGVPPKHLDLRPSPWLIHGYIETDSLNKLGFYGIGPYSSRSNLTNYAMRESIVGANATTPSATFVHLTGFAEANLRAVSLGTPAASAPLQQFITPLTAAQPYGQFAEGIRIEPSLKRLDFDYSAKLREFAAPGSHDSFEQMVVDLNHTFGLYSESAPKRDFNGPDSCDISQRNRQCPKVALLPNLEGSVGLRFLLTESFAPSGDSVPFYFQPTLGGGNINGENTLPSYADYRFRAPNVMLLRASFEHSLGKWPIGLAFMADAGKVSLTHDFSVGPWVHSFGAGVTVRAGGFPVLTVMFAFGGGEGTHTLAQVNSSLLGGSSRPSLQ